jgi:uncharacterized protein
MTGERLFLDTVFIQALLNRRDQYHRHARRFLPPMRSAAEVWVTEAVLIEVGNALSAFNRMAAVAFIQQCYQADNVHVVSVDTALFNQALDLYQARPDTAWGMTDCISFVVMQQQGLTDAVTADEHFSQAGYRALLLEET